MYKVRISGRAEPPNRGGAPRAADGTPGPARRGGSRALQRHGRPGYTGGVRVARVDSVYRFCILFRATRHSGVPRMNPVRRRRSDSPGPVGMEAGREFMRNAAALAFDPSAFLTRIENGKTTREYRNKQI